MMQINNMNSNYSQHCTVNSLRNKKGLRKEERKWKKDSQ